jgi:hypothetical protein
LLVSGDRSKAEFEQHLSELSFGAIPYDEESCRSGLARRLKIHSGPALVMLGPNKPRQVINDKVHLMGDYIRDFPYHPKRCGDFKFFPMEINLSKCVLIFCEEADDEVQADVVRACQSASEDLLLLLMPTNDSNGNNNGGPCASDRAEFKIFWNMKPNAVSESLRSAMRLSMDGRLHMVLLDLPDDCSYYVATELSSTTLCDGIASNDIVQFCKNPGERRQLV